mgnify:CR=1 FL=1
MDYGIQMYSIRDYCKENGFEASAVNYRGIRTVNIAYINVYNTMSRTFRRRMQNDRTKN